MAVATTASDSFVRDVVVPTATSIVSVTETGTIAFANRTVDRLLGYDPEQLIDARIDDIARPDSEGETAMESIHRALDDDVTDSGPASADLRLVHHDGRDVPVVADIDATTHKGERYVTLTLRERSVKESGVSTGDQHGSRADSGRLRNDVFMESVFDAIPDLVYALSDTGAWIHLNDTVTDVTGYSEDELAEMQLVDLVPPQDRDEVREEIESALRDGGTTTVESALVTKDEDRIPYEFTGAPLTDGSGDVVGLVGTGRDISEHKTRERELQRYETMVEAVEEGVGVYAMDENFRFKSVNSGAVEVTGYARDELEGMHLRELLAGEIERVAREEYEDVLSGETTAVVDLETAREARRELRESDREVLTVESPICTADGAVIPLEIRFSELPSDCGFRGTAGFLIDISERIEREQTIRRRSTAMDAAIDGIAVLDADGRYMYANQAHAHIFGYDDPDELVGESWYRRFSETGVKRLKWNVLPTVWSEGHWRGEIVGRRVDGSTFPQEVSITQLDDGDLVCVVRDATDRKQQERRLKHLNEASRELTEAEHDDDIARIGLESVKQILGFDVVCIRLFDPEANMLEPVAMTDEAEALVDDRLAFDLEATLAGQAYRTEEPVVNESYPGSSTAGEADRTSIHLPLGERGTLTIFDGPDGFDESDVHLAEVLAATIRAHLDRAEREQTVRENAETVRRQRDQLDTLNRLNGLVQDIIRELIEAGTRERIEERVCRRLASSDLYERAWIADVDMSGERITSRAAAGADERRFDDIDTVAASRFGNGTIEKALDSGEITVSRQYLVNGESTETGSEQIETTAAIPLQYGERVYGVLVVSAADEDTFDEMIQTGLTVLGETIGFAISALENRELLLSNEIVELEFEVTDPNCFAVRLSDVLDCRCDMEGTVLTGDENYLSYVRVEGASADDAQAAADAIETVTTSRVINEFEDGCLLEVVRTVSGAEVMMKFGATTKTATAVSGEGRLIVEAPRSVNVREIVTAYQEYNPESELAAKREIDRPVRTAEQLRQAVDDRLTSKQRSAIESAYAAGYYDWPRASTAEEIAESLDISSATFHQHLRRAQKELLSVFLEDANRPEIPPTATTDRRLTS